MHSLLIPLSTAPQIPSSSLTYINRHTLIKSWGSFSTFFNVTMIMLSLDNVSEDNDFEKFKVPLTAEKSR